MSVVPRNFIPNEGNENVTITRAVHTPYASYSSLDRAVLRLGLALVTWSRRTRTVQTDAEDHMMRMAQQQALEERRIAHTRALLLLNR